METEIWKDIEGYEGHYKISNLGRVKSFKFGNGKVLKLLNNKYGYLFIILRIYGILNSYKIHRLVAKAFIKNPDSKPQVNHKNGVKSDNGVENLEWATASENILHAYRTGLYKNHHFFTNHPSKGKFGKEHYNSVKVDQYSKQGLLIKNWDSFMDIQRELGIHNSSVSKCCNGVRKYAGGFIFNYK